MKSWKRAEKEVASYFGGLRRVRVSYSESVGDIIHHKYSIEVKYGKQIPKYLRTKTPILLEVEGRVNGYLIWWSKGSKKYPRRIKVKSAMFLEGAMLQAHSYSPAKIPLVCVKPKGFSGFVIAVEKPFHVDPLEPWN